MATYDYEIVNLALVRLGANRITSLSDGTKNANEANAIYTLVRDEILRDHPWGFATRHQSLIATNENILTLTQVEQSNPCTVSFTGTVPTDGDIYEADSVGGTIEIANGDRFVVNNVVSASATSLVTNGTMESGVLGQGGGTAGWTSVSSPTTNEFSNTQVHGGSLSLKVVSDSVADGVVSNGFTTVTGYMYQMTLWVYPSVTSFTIVIYRGAGGKTAGFYNVLSVQTVTATTWNQITLRYREDDGGSLAQIYLMFSTSGTFYVDDVSVTRLNSCDLYDEYGEEIDSTAYTDYTSGGTLTEVLPGSSEWDYCYDLRDPVLRVLEINGDPDEDYEVMADRYLLCNSDECRCKYIAQITDVTKYDQSFVNTFAWRLAMELAMPITGDTQKATYCSQMYNFWSARAKGTDASQGREKTPEDNRYVNARR